jgi:hypothetical protein
VIFFVMAELLFEGLGARDLLPTLKYRMIASFQEYCAAAHLRPQGATARSTHRAYGRLPAGFFAELHSASRAAGLTGVPPPR